MAKKKGIFGSIVNYIWNKSMAGKKESLINSYDHNPTVKKDLDNVDASLNKLKNSIARFDEMLKKDFSQEGAATLEEDIREKKVKRKKQLEAMLSKNEQETGIREENWQRSIREEKDKNEQETGIRETNQTRRNREKKEATAKRENARKKQLIDRFGKENTKKIHNKEIFQGMTLAMLELSKGFPEHRKITEYKKTTKKKYFYDSYENRQKNIKYKLRVDLENDIVVGYKEL
jgi:hypothetical protein